MYFLYIVEPSNKWKEVIHVTCNVLTHVCLHEIKILLRIHCRQWASKEHEVTGEGRLKVECGWDVDLAMI